MIKGKFSISLTKRNVSVIVKGLIKEGEGEEQKLSNFIKISSYKGEYWYLNSKHLNIRLVNSEINFILSTGLGTWLLAAA